MFVPLCQLDEEKFNGMTWHRLNEADVFPLLPFAFVFTINLIASRLFSIRKVFTFMGSIAFLDMIWVPDTYIENSKEEFKHVVTVPNRSFRVSPDGSIFHSQR